MMMRYRFLLPVLLALLISSCGTTKKSQSDFSVKLDEIMVRPKGEYQASATRVHDLLHTRLEVKFDFEKQYLLGEALLTLKPYSRPSNSLTLDAKGFDILKIGIKNQKGITPLPFEYDSMQLHISLPRLFTEKDTYHIAISYVAKPNELKEGGSDAISSDKGLYFINPLNNEKGKPFQVWTQGETESSSCWFPTIDKPNERTTQEIYITVPDTLVTLSNGLMVNSVKNTDGTRTDYWNMDMPHAPYLFMMAIGDYAVVKDRWRNIAVDYYVEKEFEPYARDIFGNTPEMMEFFSDKFGFDYPWQKYAQVAVRDFVSGAMENTTASIYFEYVQKTKREMIDGSFEDIVAHELMHQWFGNIVTCESWSNLTLNEGFATYGEYLWEEYKYGINAAEMKRLDMQKGYVRESWMYQEPLIRFYYNDKEDMFDSHSYAKGGLVLHMLRNYLGDEIFYKGVKIYLHDNAYDAVEVHHLRLAFEKASGEDLNWFFNQWFLSPGHPKLDIKYTYSATNSNITLTIQQTQGDEIPVFQVPLAVDIYTEKNIQRENITISKKKEEFVIPVKSKPLLVNVDGDKMLLCEKNENKTKAEWAFQYQNAPLFMDKYEALSALAPLQIEEAEVKKKAEIPTLTKNETLGTQTLIAALKDPYWGLRQFAAEKLALDDETVSLIAEVAATDEKAGVRATAFRRIQETKDVQYLPLYRKAVSDSSLEVASIALSAISGFEKEEALKLAESFEDINSYQVVTALCQLYATSENELYQDFFEEKMYRASGYTRYNVVSNYGEYLKGKNEQMVRRGVPTLEEIALTGTQWWERFAGVKAIYDLKKDLAKAKNTDSALLDYVALVLEKAIANEKDEKLIERYKMFNN